MKIKNFIIAIAMVLFLTAPAFAAYVDTFTTDSSIKTSLELLQSIGADEVFNNLEENCVKISFYDLSQISFSYANHFAINSVDSMGNRYILINSKYRKASPEEIACIIAHESFHKLAVATLEEETLATQKEAHYWGILKNEDKDYNDSALLSRLDGLVELSDASTQDNDLIKEKITRSSFYRAQLAIR